MQYIIMQLLAIVLILFIVQNNVFATVDLNIHELQYVADHLTSRECRKISEALHDKHFILFHNVTGENEPNLPCIDLLMKWDKGEGKEKTFLDLAIRLRELGHKDLADYLSRTVYHEKAIAVEKAFLSDPFKEMIHTNSPLLEESAFIPDPTVKPTPRKLWRKTDYILIAFGLISFVVITVISWRWLSPFYCKKYSKCSCCCERKKHDYYDYVEPMEDDFNIKVVQPSENSEYSSYEDI